MDDVDEVLQDLKTKMEEYFKKHNTIEKKEDLDGFLEAIDLLEIWNSDEEKDVCWQCLNKYNKKGVIDLNAAINGIKDLMNQEEDKETHETLLTHLSRRASMRDPKKGKLTYARMKEFAIDEYECIDDDTLLQIKKIFSLLKISQDNNKIEFKNIQDLCTENKFIKITPEEIWKYLAFLSVDNNIGSIKRPMLIHLTLYGEIQKFINEKTPDDDDEIGDNHDDDKDDEAEEDTDEDEPLEIIEKIINNTDTIQGETKAFSDIINSLNILINDMVEKAQNILNGNDTTLDDVLFVKDLMSKKLAELNKHNKIIDKQQKSNNNKMEKITFYINKLKGDLQNLEEDYKALNSKFENHQDNINTNDDEVERLFGENLTLYQDKEAKEKEIQQLNEEKKELENKYNNLFAQFETVNNKNKELTDDMNDIKVRSLKYKTEYEEALEKLINLEKIYNQKLLKQEEKSKEEEDLDKSEDVLASFSKKQGFQKSDLNNFMATRKSQLITFPKKIALEDEKDETDEEKLVKYVKELEKMNEILTERNKDSTMKIKELENIISKNSNISKLVQKTSDPNKLLKLNEIFNPSLYEIFKERICLISELSNFNPKKNKIVKKHSFIIGASIFVKSNKNVILSKQNSSQLNYKGIVKILKRQTTFDNKLLNVISNNSNLNIKNINKKIFDNLKLNKVKFDINILRPTKKPIKLEKIHSDLSIINKAINTIKKNNIIIEYKIENVEKFFIEEQLSIEKKRSELTKDSEKINLLFNDDTDTIKTNNNNFEIDKIKDSEDDFLGEFHGREQRSSTIMINPKELFESKDYYCLFQEEYVRRKLGHLNDVCAERNIYSEQIYVLVEKKSLLKKYLLLTPLHFCVLDLNTLKFVYVDKIKNIKNIVVSSKNLNMILFRFQDGEDLLIESLRPYDLLIYLKNTYFQKNKDKDSIFRYEDKFIIKLKGQLHSLIVTDKILTNMPNFEGAIKVGNLLLYKAKFISSNFTETIGVLLEMGLYLFEESTLKPIMLIPILGSKIKKVEKERFGNNNCFEITMPNGTTKVFAVRKTRERESWLLQISKIRKDFDEKMKKIEVVKKANTKKVAKFK